MTEPAAYALLARLSPAMPVGAYGYLHGDRRLRRRQDPVQGRPRQQRSDLLVINKIDLAPLVGAWP